MINLWHVDTCHDGYRILIKLKLLGCRPLILPIVAIGLGLGLSSIST